MKTKIEIRTCLGKLLYEFEKEDNSVRGTLQEAVTQGADLQGANLQGVKIKNAIVFTGLYKYVVIPFIAEDGEKYIKMGCHTRKLSEWESDFWNNEKEFPNNNSEKSNLAAIMRLFAYETAKRWFEVKKDEI